MASARSRLVAEISRTLTLIGSLVPTRTISPVSSTRSSLIWIGIGMSPISSRKSVPPLAYWNRPMRSRSAPVKAPFTWPKSSLSRMFSRQLGAVERHERLVLARAVDVQRLGDQLLAGAALAGDQHRGRRRRDLAELGHDRVHRRRVADHPLEAELLVELLLQLDVRSLQPLRLRRLVGDGPQLVDIERLGQVGRGPGLHGGDGRLDRAVAGQDHDLGVGQLALGLGQDLEPADSVHDQVGDDDVEDLLFDQPEALGAAGGHDAVVADPLEALGHGRGVRLIVVDHQDADLLVHRSLLAFRGDGLTHEDCGPGRGEHVFARRSDLGGDCRSRFKYRQPHAELRALARLALHVDRAAMRLDDLAGGRQAQAASRRRGSRRTRRRSAPEPPRSFPRPVSITSSTTHGPSRRVVRISSPPEGIACSAFKTRFKSSLLEQARDRCGIDGKSAREPGADHDSLGRRVRLVEVAQLVDDRVQIGRLELQVLHPGKPQEALEDVVQPMDLVPQPLEPLQHAPVTRGLRRSESPRAADRG